MHTFLSHDRGAASLSLSTPPLPPCPSIQSIPQRKYLVSPPEQSRLVLATPVVVPLVLTKMRKHRSPYENFPFFLGKPFFFTFPFLSPWSKDYLTLELTRDTTHIRNARALCMCICTLRARVVQK